MPSAFLSTDALPLTRPIDYTLSSLPPSQWAGWKNAVFLWMKLRQRLVPLRVSWLVDRGRITPHHRNWRQRGLGEGIARSPPELCYTEAIRKSENSGATRNPCVARRTRYRFLENWNCSRPRDSLAARAQISARAPGDLQSDGGVKNCPLCNLLQLP